ncbi:MAG: YfhO family protein [Anaerolineae bacterium]|nr:YfhO family protein [Anaerolineae bacterium]
MDRKDGYALLLLTALWALFFWRALVAGPADQVSLAEGDFSGQFYAFSAYQAGRLLAGEVPLWNPYSNAGHPFLADTQAAVFYPPRLFAIYLSRIFGGWSYGALQLEAIAHYWLAGALMYVFARQTTANRAAGLVAALTWTYGGYLVGYPILQLAILESAVWTPLVLLGIHQATREPGKVGWACMVLAGVGLGISLLAGHPQTALFIVYMSLAYLAYRLWFPLPALANSGTDTSPPGPLSTGWRGGEDRDSAAPVPPLHDMERGLGGEVDHLSTYKTLSEERFKMKARRFILAAAVLGLVGAGLAAVQLAPGWEYLQRTTRAGMSFDAKAGGFPVRDIAQFLAPDLVSYWSPLYVGLAGLALAIAAVWRRRAGSGSGFWGGVALAGLGLSLGGNTVIYAVAYNLAPGMNLFRGQERAAFVVSFGLAMLAGQGVASLAGQAQETSRRFARRFMLVLAGGAALIFILAAALFVAHIDPAWYGNAPLLDAAARAALTAALTLALFAWRLSGGDYPYWTAALVALVVFDLFSVNMGRSFEPVPAGERPHLSELATHEALYGQAQPFRVDGREGLGGNCGALLGLADIEGISPLRLASHDELLRLPEALRWRLLGVRYVFSARAELPVESEIVAAAHEGGQDIYLHELAEPHPLAWLDDAQPGDWPEPFTPLAGGSVTFTAYGPERIAVAVRSPQAAFVFFGEYDYPGWQATLDGAPVDILTAWGYLRAVAVPAGAHTVEMVYRPLSFTAGAAVSAGTLLLVIVVALRPWRRKAEKR